VERHRRIEDVATPAGSGGQSGTRAQELRQPAARTIARRAARRWPSCIGWKFERHYDVHIVTQNGVDDLHERAGSTQVLHLRGQLRQVRSDGVRSHSCSFMG